METRKIGMVLLAYLCSFRRVRDGASPQTQPDEQLIAMNTPRTDTPARARRLRPRRGRPESRTRSSVIPPRSSPSWSGCAPEISAQTRQVPEPRWSNEVRPVLRRQLGDAGLPKGDVDFLLSELDAARR